MNITKYEIARRLKIFTEMTNNKKSELLPSETISLSGYTLRDEQLDILEYSINHIIQDKYREVFYRVDTGIGKSLLGISTILLLHDLKYIDLHQTLVLTHRNKLFEQYRNSFNFILAISGKSNYMCDYKGIPVVDLKHKTICQQCPIAAKCEYNTLVREIMIGKIVLTNYNWLIYNRFTNYLLFNKNHIFDEVGINRTSTCFS